MTIINNKQTNSTKVLTQTMINGTYLTILFHHKYITFLYFIHNCWCNVDFPTTGINFMMYDINPSVVCVAWFTWQRAKKVTNWLNETSTRWAATRIDFQLFEWLGIAVWLRSSNFCTTSTQPVCCLLVAMVTVWRRALPGGE